MHGAPAEHITLKACICFAEISLVDFNRPPRARSTTTLHALRLTPALALTPPSLALTLPHSVGR
eukprot:1186593-Prorocentrum_minimum.AAC.2